MAGGVKMQKKLAPLLLPVDRSPKTIESRKTLDVGATLGFDQSNSHFLERTLRVYPLISSRVAGLNIS
jgi:hypothetical protein